MTVTNVEYQKEKLAFFQKYNCSYNLETSSMDEYGAYYKTYTFTNGAQWYERMAPKYEKVNVEVKKIIVAVEVKLLETEYWSTESPSKCCYENF